MTATRLDDTLVEFVTALRSKGITAGPGETVDAGAVIEVLGLADRGRLREGLAAALIRTELQRPTFDAVFDLYFPAGSGRREATETAGELDIDELRAQLADALARGDVDEIARLAAIAVDRFGRLGVATDGWSGFITLERVQPQNLLARAMQGRGAGPGSGPGSGGPGSGELGRRTEQDDIRSLIAGFRRNVLDEARRRSAEVGGRDRMVTHGVPKSIDQVDFLTANQAQLDELRRVVRPLARRLATRLASKRRRRSRGRVDIRRTLRRSLSTGGVPIDLSMVRPHPTRPELVLLCDVSGSVAGFSSFTMLLVQAMKGQFSRVRVFAFVNAMAEITDLVDDEGDLQRRIHAQAPVTRLHSSSDYGAALTQFADEHLDAIGPRTSVLVLGDGRNNYGRAHVEKLQLIADRARRTFWLNPERTALWGTGDSAALAYAEVVEMHECRTVEQLGSFVSRLLPV